MDKPAPQARVTVVTITFPNDWGDGMRSGYQRLLASCLEELDFQASMLYDLTYDKLPEVELKTM